MSKTILMCEPNLFNVNYEINPWMEHKINSVDSDLAYKQWKSLMTILSEKSKTVIMEKQSTLLPDIVFTANAGLIIDNTFITSNFQFNERKPESFIFSRHLNEIGFSVDNYFIENDIAFEGAGDALFSHSNKSLFLAHGFRTSKLCSNHIVNVLKNHNSSYTLYELELIDPRFYHLDTCFCPLDNGLIMYYPKAFSMETREKLIGNFGNKLIEVSEEDAITFVCNAVSVSNNLILNKVSDDFKNYLNLMGINVYEAPMSEFLKSGGSCKCLTLNLEENLSNV